jgi:hypothetical protein
VTGNPLFPIPDHPGFRRGEFRQRRDRVARLHLLRQARAVFTTITSRMTAASFQSPVLSTPPGGRASWLRAGQALQRVLLTATGRGVSASPLTQPLETTDAWLVRDPRSGFEDPQMILRIGYGLPVPSAPRRPVPDVLDQ